MGALWLLPQYPALNLLACRACPGTFEIEDSLYGTYDSLVAQHDKMVLLEADAKG